MKKVISFIALAFAIVAFSTSTSNTTANAAVVDEAQAPKKIYCMVCRDCGEVWAGPCNIFEWHCPKCNSTNVYVGATTICFD